MAKWPERVSRRSGHPVDFSITHSQGEEDLELATGLGTWEMSDGLSRNSFMGVVSTEIIVTCTEGGKYVRH